MSTAEFLACVQCGWRFIPRWRGQTCCSRSCAGRRGALVTLAKYPQAGEQNFNFRGWSSKQPSVYARRFKTNNPEKVQAHRLLSAAIHRGEIVRPQVCERCGVSCKPDGHHEDYSQPLVVAWVCRRCHLACDRARQSVAMSFGDR